MTVAWQGGEPTLMGLDFFRRSIDYQMGLREARHADREHLPDQRPPPRRRVVPVLSRQQLPGRPEHGRPGRNSTTATGRTGEATGPSTASSGPRDCSRSTRWSSTSSARSTRRTPTIRSTSTGSSATDSGRSTSSSSRSWNGRTRPAIRTETVTDRSVRPEQWGRFLIAIFDEWVKRDVGRTFVLNFDGALAGWLGQAGTVCIFGPTCGLGMALEHNGDLYSCDHFVEPAHFLGKHPRDAHDRARRLREAAEVRTGQAGHPSPPVPGVRVPGICNGECPKNRFVEADGETGLNYLCEGYKAFFAHADPAMKVMADLIRRGRPADEIMAVSGKKRAAMEEDPRNRGETIPASAEAD